MNKNAPCYGKMHGHNFPYTGADCLLCGVNQAELSGGLKKPKDTFSQSIERVVHRKPNPNLHSELHGLVEELRREYGETAKKGKGSFGFYLGMLKRISVHDIYRLRSEVKQSDCSSPRRLFWWKYKQLMEAKKADVDKASQQNCNDKV